MVLKKFQTLKMSYLRSQWLTGFKLLGIPYLVGKMSAVHSRLFFRVLSDGSIELKLSNFWGFVD